MGVLNPGQVSLSEGHLETSESNSNSWFHSHLGTIKSHPITQHSCFCSMEGNWNSQNKPMHERSEQANSTQEGLRPRGDFMFFLLTGDHSEPSSPSLIHLKLWCTSTVDTVTELEEICFLAHLRIIYIFTIKGAISGKIHLFCH